MTVSSGSDAHLLIIPYPAQGHMIPLLDLTQQLVLHSFTITILTTPKNLHLLDSLLSTHPASINTLVLPFPTHPSIPQGLENTKDLAPTSFEAMICCLSELYDPITQWFKSHPSPPAAIISDMFLGWTHRLAYELSIHRIVFSPSGAMALSVMYSLWRDLPRRENLSDEKEAISLPNIPSSPKYPWWKLSPLYRSFVEANLDSEFIKDAFRANMASWGLVINSFNGLERVYLENLKKDMGHDRVWAVGPLLPSGPNQRGGSSSVKVEEILSWLDTCEDRKVVYVCFGSQARLNNNQMEKLAFGLEKSGVQFVWVVKEPTEVYVDGDNNTVPQGFEDRVAGKGLVIKGWAPQVLILSHRAVGAFLTHCGWNSVLEGIIAGVPLLTWPLGADQFVNDSLLVDELNVAIRVGEGRKFVPDPDELSRVLVDLVSQERVECKRAAELRGVALEAIEEGGSSVIEFDSMVSKLAALSLPVKNSTL
nr:UDP-glycosyltransferase 89B2-like [Quercus suber]POF07364.1 udp-glycosyltransferase 89b2 [Quercus suber]